MTGEASETVRSQTSLAAWDIPEAVASGEHFTVKAGVKSSSGCALGGCRITVLDGDGTVVASGLLGAAPWQDTEALYWSEIELCAPAVPGLVSLAVRFDAVALEEPHDGASRPFSIAVVPPPEHVLTVTVAAADGPVADAIVRAGPLRAMTDAEGRARLHLAKGRHELAVWKTGYEAQPVPLTVDADVAIRVEARALPEENHDAIWTA